MNRNSSIFSSSLYVRRFILTAAGLLSVVILFVVIVDPNNTLALSPPLERYPAATNQRFSYPSIARSGEFDSLVLGTSTTRMLEPANLNKNLKVRLANLSMNSATWWEQEQIFNLFLRHHTQPRLIIWGIDTIWCSPEKIGPRLTPRKFPRWLYDENKWNDYLHLLNFKTLERAGKQLGILLGLRQPNYGRDGYRSLNKKGTPYDLAKARRKIYGQTEPVAPAKALDRPSIDAVTRKNWQFPNLKTLDRLISKTDENTRVVLMMVPYHQNSLGPPNGPTMLKYNECKKRVFKLSDRFQNTDVIDFMFRSSFTSEDRNYWDPLHFNEQGAQQIENALVDFIAKGKTNSPIYRTSLTPRQADDKS